MKILHLLSCNSFSGAENVACTIIESLDESYECIYCSPNGSIKDVLLDKGINYYPLSKLSLKELKKALKDIQPDIIHAHDYKASCLASFFHKKYKIISHIHGNKKIMHKRNIKSYLYKILSKNINKIIWVSDSCLNEYVYKKDVINKSIILYNTVNKKDVINKSKEYQVNKNYDLIYLGRLIDIKDPEKLFEIVKRLSYLKQDIKVAVVGDGPLLNRIKHLTKIFCLDNNIDFYGYVSNPYPILNKSKILIITSKYEGTPMVSLEASALKKPIVSTPIDGMKKIIKNGYNGYLCNTYDDFINKILEILNNYSLYTKNVNKNFININDEKGYLKSIKEIYKSL